MVPGCGFLFAFYSNYGAILYPLRDIATYWLKIAKFLYPTCIYSAPARGDRPRRNFLKMFNADRTRMTGLPYRENYDSILSCFHPIPERYVRTDRQTDGRTDRIPISISRVSMLTRDKFFYHVV